MATIKDPKLSSSVDHNLSDSYRKKSQPELIGCETQEKDLANLLHNRSSFLIASRWLEVLLSARNGSVIGVTLTRLLMVVDLPSSVVYQSDNLPIF